MAPHGRGSSRLILAKELVPLREKRRQQFFKNIFLAGAVLVFLLGFFVYAPIFRFEKILVDEKHFLARDLTASTEEFLFKKTIFPKNHLFLYPEDSLRAILLQKSPQLKEIIFDRHFFGQRSLTILPIGRLKKFVSCDLPIIATTSESFLSETIPEIKDEQKNKSTGADSLAVLSEESLVENVLPATTNCFWADEGGFRFTETSEKDSKGKLFVYHHQTTSSPNSLLAQVSAPGGVSFSSLSAVNDLLFKFGLETISVKETEGGIAFSLSAGGEIYLAKDFLIEEIDYYLKELFETRVFAEKFKEQRADFLYLDLRFGHKIFYKFAK